MTTPLVVSDTTIQFGAPTIAGTRITVSTIVERFLSGESMMAIVQDYETTIPHVEAALRLGLRHRSEAEMLKRLHKQRAR